MAKAKSAAQNPLDILRQSKRKPAERDTSVRYVVTMLELETWDYPIGHHTIPRAKLVPLVPQNYIDHRSPDDETRNAEDLGTIRYAWQPGAQARALQMRFTDRSLIVVDVLTGEEDADLIQELQDSIFPDDLVLPRDNWHSEVTVYLNELIEKNELPESSLEYAVIQAFILSNEIAEGWKINWLLGIDAEAADRKAGGDGRNSLSEREVQWRDEVGIELSENVGTRYSITDLRAKQRLAEAKAKKIAAEAAGETAVAGTAPQIVLNISRDDLTNALGNGPAPAGFDFEARATELARAMVAEMLQSGSLVAASAPPAPAAPALPPEPPGAEPRDEEEADDAEIGDDAHAQDDEPASELGSSAGTSVSGTVAPAASRLTPAQRKAAENAKRLAEQAAQRSQ